MANLNVTYEEMRTAATNLASAEAEIERELQQAKAKIETLLAEGFVTTEASVAFGRNYEEFTVGVSKTVTGLTGMAGYLKAAADALENTDRELAKAQTA